MSHNNNIVSHVDDENDNCASVDNKDNNKNDEVNGIIAPIIQNSPPPPPIERGLSSKSILTFNYSSDEIADNSRHSMYAEPMDVDPPSIIRAACRNVLDERAKGTIGVRIIVATCGASRPMIGEGRAWMIMLWYKQMQIKTPPLR